MSVQKILYEDKETFQTSPLDEVNKATSANYNEIKDVVNFNADELDSIVEGVWVPALTTGDVSAVQNTATSDISAQTGTKTFTGLDWDITTAGRTSTGDVNFFNLKKDTVSKFKVDIDGNITAAADTDATTILGRTQLDSRSTDHATFSHVDQTGGTAYALRQSSIGDTNLNATGGRSIKLLTGANTRWTVDQSGHLNASTGVNFNLSTTSVIQWGGIDSITGDGTGDIAIGGDMTLGNSGLSGSTRRLTAEGSSANVGLDLFTKGSGVIHINSNNKNLFLGTDGSDFLISPNDSGTQKLIIRGSTSPFASDGADLILQGGGSDSGAGANLILIGGNSVSSTDGAIIMFKPDGTTKILEINTTGIGFFNTTPVAQPSAYTRNATIVEDKTLLASASATTINNNNVLAALINDLQLLGLVA